jgi:hypothetical protein
MSQLSKVADFGLASLVVPALAVLLWFWSSLGVRCVVSVRVRAAFNPASYKRSSSAYEALIGFYQSPVSMTNGPSLW